MAAEMWDVAETIATALRTHEKQLTSLTTQHMSNQGTTRPVCYVGTTLVDDDSKVVRNIDHVDCVDCLRKLAKDAGRYGNERRPRR